MAMDNVLNCRLSPAALPCTILHPEWALRQTSYYLDSNTDFWLSTQLVLNYLKWLMIGLLPYVMLILFMIYPSSQSYQWFHSRSQRVILPNGFSQWSNLSSGVLQGKRCCSFCI